VDWASSPDWEWESAGQLSPEELLARWREAIEASDRAIETVLGGHGLDTLTERAWPDGTRPSLRWVMVHMIEEYGRHCGHADLLREAIDGATGE
jgi:hypothetical protein